MQDDNGLILVDADSIYFKAACKATTRKDLQRNIDSLMADISSQCFCGDLKVAVKGNGNFRKDLYKPYKGTRPDLKEELKKSLRHGHKYMVKKWGAVTAHGMEADDLVSIWAYEARELELWYTVVGIDKDLLQITGNHYNFNKKTHVFVDDDQAHKNLMIQCLVGDTSDNIPGIRGIGPKKAEKLLEGVSTDAMWSHVQKAWLDNNAGDPKMSLRLLSMIKTWEEWEDIKSSIQDKTPECKQDAGSEREKILQES